MSTLAPAGAAGTDAFAEFVAVVPVREGHLPAGAAEAVAEAGGRALLIGDGLDEAAGSLRGVARDLRLVPAGPFAPGAWAVGLAPLLADTRVVVLPASPDGRDLAPRLAAQLDRPLFASAIRIEPTEVTSVRLGGRAVSRHELDGPAVVTLQPGVRTVEPGSDDPAPVGRTAELDEAGRAVRDAVVESVLPPDIATMDLSEAPRLLGGGAGLDSAERFEQLRRVAASLDASMGATRVITDRGWLGHSRQIGTTGVVVDPSLYIAFGISGAVQHTAGLGHPEHVISINTDEHCPMMELADLAIVADANQTLDELDRLFKSSGATGGGLSGEGGES
ncbi:MAG: mycofactocin-associated electron transfer flavoprotein alpha subunit [Microthrixaceae bacterium]